MTRPAEPPPRPVAVWAATLVVSLHCSWLVFGGLLRFAQEALGFGDDWFERLRLPRTYDLIFAGLLTVTAAALLLCQLLAVFVRERLASTIVGAVIFVWGMALLVVVSFLFAWFRGHETTEIWTVLGVGATGTAANLFAGVTMLRWGRRLAEPPTPLAPAPSIYPRYPGP